MRSTFKVSLKGGERFYVNGAVLRVDRKVLVELLNEVSFLLEQHVMKPEETTTPLRRLYYLLQGSLTEPSQAEQTFEVARQILQILSGAAPTEALASGLARVGGSVENKRYYEALRTIRTLLPLEDELLLCPHAKLVSLSG